MFYSVDVPMLSMPIFKHCFFDNIPRKLREHFSMYRPFG